MFRVFKFLSLMILFSLGTGAPAHVMGHGPSLILATLVSKLDLPFEAQSAIYALTIGGPNGPWTRVADLVQLKPEQFAPPVAERINTFLKPFGLRLGLLPDDVNRLERAGLVPSEVERGLRRDLDPSTLKMLVAISADSAADLSARYTESTLGRFMSRAQVIEVMEYAARAGFPLRAHPFAALSDRLQFELKKYKIQSAADFSERVTFAQIYHNPMPQFWLEMIEYCLEQGHPVKSGAKATARSCADETKDLTLRAQKSIARLKISGAEDLARRFSLMSLGQQKIGMNTMRELIDWAATCGHDMVVTEKERLARVNQTPAVTCAPELITSPARAGTKALEPAAPR